MKFQKHVCVRQGGTMKAILSVLVLATISAANADQNPSAAFIQRTMKWLEESNKDNPARVRVMFYGQSITAQAWTGILQQHLKKKYPTVDFEFHNAAIGGYTSNVLIRTADHDLYPWYPDLLFFHVYGPMDQYEEIIRRVRQRTTSEVVIWTSHLNSRSRERPDEIDTSHDKRAVEIREVAKRHKCMLIDLREKWRDYLNEENLKVSELLTDTVHLNPRGCELYARIVGEELVRLPEVGDNATSAGTITQVPIDSEAVERSGKGKLTLRFRGNRVVAVSNGRGSETANATVTLDGRSPREQKELWAITRPSVGPARIWMPAINHIGFDTAPVEEAWTLTCLPDSTPDGKRIHFEVEGTITGNDGAGWNSERFISRSGRVSIEPADWRIAWTLGYRKATLPEGFQVTWRAYPLFTDTYLPQATGNRTLLVQGCSNEEHSLTLDSRSGVLGISHFVVYSPR
jgi:hypothetical protein